MITFCMDCTLWPCSMKFSFLTQYKSPRCSLLTCCSTTLFDFHQEHVSEGAVKSFTSLQNITLYNYISIGLWSWPVKLVDCACFTDVFWPIYCPQSNRLQPTSPWMAAFTYHLLCSCGSWSVSLQFPLKSLLSSAVTRPIKCVSNHAGRFEFYYITSCYAIDSELARWWIIISIIWNVVGFYVWTVDIFYYFLARMHSKQTFNSAACGCD